MTKKIIVPELGESVVEATVGQWQKNEGDQVEIGDVLVNLETDKVDVEIGAQSAGVLVEIQRGTGEDVKIGEVLGLIEENGRSAGKEPEPVDKESGKAQESTELKAQESEEPLPGSEDTDTDLSEDDKSEEPGDLDITPVAMRYAREHEIDLQRLSKRTGDGRITKEKVKSYLEQEESQERDGDTGHADETAAVAGDQIGRRQERKKLSRRRRTIARRLIEAQQTTASLTTFNDIDLQAVVNLRQERQERFVEKHGFKMGFTSFFVKASVAALKDFPRLNAEMIDEQEIVLKYFYDIGIAVGAEKGLVVPVIRDADRMSLAQIEKAIRDLAQKAADSTLSLDELRGGTFTITNGGVFGSLLSTPILNPPQVGILGLHRIENRPVAVNEEVVIHPMMYAALTYDHRIVDGREAVQFLARVKKLIEDPELLLIEG